VLPSQTLVLSSIAAAPTVPPVLLVGDASSSRVRLTSDGRLLKLGIAGRQAAEVEFLRAGDLGTVQREHLLLLRRAVLDRGSRGSRFCVRRPTQGRDGPVRVGCVPDDRWSRAGT
jgi:hypothetical protein